MMVRSITQVQMDLSLCDAQTSPAPISLTGLSSPGTFTASDFERKASHDKIFSMPTSNVRAGLYSRAEMGTGVYPTGVNGAPHAGHYTKMVYKDRAGLVAGRAWRTRV